MIIKFGKLDYISNKHVYNKKDVFFLCKWCWETTPASFLVIAEEKELLERYAKVYLFLSPENEL